MTLDQQSKREYPIGFYVVFYLARALECNQELDVNALGLGCNSYHRGNINEGK